MNMDAGMNFGGQLPMLNEDGELEYDGFHTKHERVWDKATVQEEMNNKMTAAIAESQGERDSMEDAYAMDRFNETGWFFGVFDGHGGKGCSGYVSQNFTKKIKAKPPTTDGDLETLCFDIDQDFLNLYGGETGGVTDASGSTGAFCILTALSSSDYHMKVAWVGDSRILIHKSSRTEPMTTDHKADHPDEKARINAAGGWVSRGRVDGKLGVSRAFGDAYYKNSSDPKQHKVIAMPSIRETKLRDGDLIVIGCDGVFETGFEDDQVMSIVLNALKTGGVGDAARAVCDEALTAGSTDNCTCMVIRVGDGNAAIAAPMGILSGGRSRSGSPVSPPPVLGRRTPESLLHLLLLERGDGEGFGFTVEGEGTDWNKVGTVAQGGPAWRSWLRPGMFLVAVAGRPVTSRDTFNRMMRKLELEETTIPIMIRADTSIWARVRREQVCKGCSTSVMDGARAAAAAAPGPRSRAASQPKASRKKSSARSVSRHQRPQSLRRVATSTTTIAPTHKIATPSFSTTSPKCTKPSGRRTPTASAPGISFAQANNPHFRSVPSAPGKSRPFKH
eukprot:TRINITY_DN5957_c0_g1_i1.p1 TRINITY_DN5957_c0_g1~~TRINITY_DN5957_c0_g1_i1.p1  ORF type:complete len:560 (+),score=111.41 TRINITY_DN5957_c0_g1_i1:2-1681(+)